MPLISVVVVTYNASDVLGCTLESLRDLRGILGEELEVIVIDGASSDDTVAQIEAAGLADVLVSAPDQGIYDAMNKGVALAHGDWLHFLNAGDSLRTVDDINAILAALRDASPSFSWAIAGAQNLGGGNGDQTLIKNIPHSWLKHLVGMQSHCHQACWFRRSAFIATGGFRLDLSTAADFASIVQFGVLSRPMEINRVAVDYLGGGISDVTAAQGQLLLHRIRVEILGLSARSARIDLALAYFVMTVNSSRIFLGRVRGKCRGSLRRFIRSKAK